MSKICEKIPQRRLGKSAVEASRLLFGTLTMGKMQRALSFESGARLLIYAYERYGIDFVDTAQLYETYPYIALALKQAPLKVQTKSYAYDEKTARQSFEEAVRGIGREYIDVFMLHEQESVYTLKGHEEALRFLQKKKEEGYIGALGVSTHHVACVKACVNNPYVEIVFALYNMLGLGIADGTREEMFFALQTLKSSGKGVECMKVLGGGHLILHRKEALRHCLSAGLFDCIALGMQDIQEIDYAASLFLGKEPDETLAQKADRRLLIDDWCEGCGACVKRCKQEALFLKDGKAQVKQERCALCGYCASVCPNFCIKVI